MKPPFASHVDTLATTSPNETRARLSGILLFVVATMCFTGIDTCAKLLIQTLPVPQVVWLRFVTHAVLTSVVIVAVLGRRTPWRSKRPFVQAARAILVGLSTLFNFTGLQTVPLAEANAIFFITPIVVAVIAGPLLGEWAGPRRWAAILVAFVGVLIVIRPGTDAFTWAALFIVAAACAYSLYNIATRLLAGRDDPVITLALTPVGGVLVFAPAALAVWQTPPDLESWGLILGLGLFGGVGHGILLLALRRAPAPVLAPFIYIQIIWMTLSGFFVFGDVPHRWTLVGAAVVVASGVYLWFRERKATEARL